MKKYLPALFILFGIFLIHLSAKDVHAITISNIELHPDLDISYFSDYTLTASMSAQPSSASLTLSGINYAGGTDWIYYVDGSVASSLLSYSLIFDSGTTWKKTAIRPDHIYPTILFAPASVTWGVAPSNINIRRNNYHLMHFSNPFNMTDDMNFWIEINASPVSTNSSADLLVYLVKKDKEIGFFNSDWRESSDLELVGVINRNDDFHHEHSDNSSHHLIRLTAKTGGLFGSNNLNISGDFWLVLYDTAPNTNRGWNLKYHSPTICTNSNDWYTANQTGWTTTSQAGCPDVHVHLARRDAVYMDGVRATVTADGSSETQDFYFGTLPNLAPNSTTFTNPLRGTYAGTVTVNWDPASDPNENTVKYNLYLLDENENVIKTLTTNSLSTNYDWATALEDDGNYFLKGTACDDSLCSEFYSEPFTIDNINDIYSLSSISMTSNNSDTTIARAGNVITLSFSATGLIPQPTVAFYSGGENVAGSVTVSSTTGNEWIAYYTVSSNDTNGQVTFTINGERLSAEYSEITAGSYVTVNISSSSGNSISSASPPVCSDSKPSSTPDLYRIDVSSKKAVLYYTTLAENNNGYYISFSEKPNTYEHGAYLNKNSSEKNMSFDVFHLKPSTTYYFRVRGQNGCMPGDWSNEMKITTKKTGINSFTKIYKNASINNINFTEVVKNMSHYKIEDSKTKIYSPTPFPTPAPIKSDQNKKRCFLFWCW